MKNNKNNKKTIMLIILIVLILGIGYASLRANLQISGTSTIKNNNFSIKFNNIVETEGSATPTKAATIGSDNTSVSFDVVLENPGDYYGFNVDIVNAGSLNAMIETFEKSALTEEQKNYLTYEVTYSNGDMISIGDFLAKKSTRTLKVLLSYKENPEELPISSEELLTFSFNLNFVETASESKYEGKVVSILGDSVSTLKGYIPEGNRPRYVQTEAEAIDGLLYMPYEETWWGQVINENKMTLGVNDSWAGSQVLNTSSTNSGDIGPDIAMASMTRLQKLDDNGTPDLILFYGGSNDIGRTVTKGTFDPNADYAKTLDTTSTTYNSFVEAYTIALLRMKHLYPNAEIVSLLPTYTVSYYDTTKLETYNSEIIKICEHFGIKYIDLRLSGITTSNFMDGAHPDATGMDYLSSYITKKLNGEYTNNAVVRTSANEYAQALPSNLTSETNLYAALTPRPGYYNATGYVEYKTDGIEVYSIVIPVVPGDKIKSSGFDEPQPGNESSLGGRTTFLMDNTIVVSKAPTEVYAEYTQNGYLTVPEGVNTVCVTWWNPSDENWAYLLVD